MGVAFTIGQKLYGLAPAAKTDLAATFYRYFREPLRHLRVEKRYVTPCEFRVFLRPGQTPIEERMQSASMKDTHFRHPSLLDPLRDALFLDLDGTLLEIADHPSAVQASPSLLALLRALRIHLDGACAVITGRTVADADNILKGALGSIAGVHGAEFKTPVASIVQRSIESEPVWAARAEAHALASRLRLLIEDKRASLALHYRSTPDLATEVHAGAEEIAAAHGLRVMKGQMVVELIAGQRTKGDALDAFMRQAPFAGRRPIAVGDDVTDEDAFASAAKLGGFGVLVGNRRDSAAAFGLADPASVAAWLQASLEGPVR